jgi:hypothetical protein
MKYRKITRRAGMGSAIFAVPMLLVTVGASGPVIYPPSAA